MAAPKLNVEWTHEEIERLIEEYEKYPCLYNTTIKEYKDRDKRKISLLKIAAVFDRDVTPDDVFKKFSRLRTQYNRERAKLTAAPKSGSAPDDTPKISWVHFDSLHFLKDFCTPKCSRSNFTSPATTYSEDTIELDETATSPSDIRDDFTDSQHGEEDSQKTFEAPLKSTKRPTGRKRSRRQQEDDQDSLIEKAVNALEKVTASPVKGDNEMSSDDIFGQFVASELKGIKDEYMKKMIKHKIHTALFETQLHTFSHAPTLPSFPHVPTLPSFPHVPTLPSFPPVTTLPSFSMAGSAPRILHPFDNTLVPSPSFSQVTNLSLPQTPQREHSAQQTISAQAVSASPSSPTISEFSAASNSSQNSFTIL